MAWHKTWYGTGTTTCSLVEPGSMTDVVCRTKPHVDGAVHWHGISHGLAFVGAQVGVPLRSHSLPVACKHWVPLVHTSKQATPTISTASEMLEGLEKKCIIYVH